MSEVDVEISNVGGIDDLSCTLSAPITVVSGPNASNKTSLLRAIAFALGHPTVPIKNDAEEARVALEYDGTRVVRTARRDGGGISVEGDAWLEDADDVELLERFGCLLEFNDLRTAVRNGNPVESLLKSPMQLDALERERSETVARKTELQRERSTLADVEETIETREDELATVLDRIGDLEDEVERLRERRAEATNGDDLDPLQNERAELVARREDLREEIGDLEASIRRLDERIADVEGDVETARERADSHDIETLEAERDRIREDLRDVTDRIDVLQSVLTANREMLASSYAGVLGRETTLVEDAFVCWACGNEASEADFEETVEELTDLVDRETERRREFEPRLEELETEIEAAESADDRIDDLETERRRLEDQRTEREESLETKREQLEALEAEIDELDERLAARTSARESAVDDLSAEIEEARVDLHAAEQRAETLESTIDDLHEQRARREEIDAEIDDLSAEIATLTDRIETLEGRLREAFNDAMADLLSALEYDRIDRVRLDGEFELVVARETDGVVRRDGVDHVSESERELIGVVLALSGYLTYDVPERVPILLMDTLGAFDAERTADLLEYVERDVPYLVTALLPESASAVESADLDHARLRPVERAESA